MVEKYLITGFSGFVSGHFCEYLERNGIDASIKGLDLRDHNLTFEKFKRLTFDFEKVNLLSIEEITRVLQDFKPDYILHLASDSSVAFSWKKPIASFNNNTNVFLNILEAARVLNLGARILSIGSSEEYGEVSENLLPLREDAPLNPTSPYAVARVAQELLSKIYVNGYGLDIVMTRSFNHLGPMQKETFVIASFAKQLTDIKKSNRGRGDLIAGDTSVVRDFCDVRDVVRAYYLLLQGGKKGEIYNVCSGRGISLHEIILNMSAVLNLEVGIKVDRTLIRPDENRIVVGCNEKICRELGWSPGYTMKQSLSDILEYWDGIR